MKKDDADMTQPDPVRVQQLAGDAVQALRTVQEQLHRDAEAVQDARRQIESDREEMNRIEAELRELKETLSQEKTTVEARATEVEKRHSSVTAVVEKFETEKKALHARQQELDEQLSKLTELRQSQHAAAALLAEREHKVAVAEQNIQAQTSQLQTQAAEMTARARSLEEKAAELEVARDAIAAMHSQLNRDHDAVALQREELLHALNSASRLHPAGGNGQVLHEAPVSNAAPLSNVPRPASVSGAEQFRKLRRDAKRKAIGV